MTEEKTTEEVAPCPFCGSEFTLHESAMVKTLLNTFIEIAELAGLNRTFTINQLKAELNKKLNEEKPINRESKHGLNQ